MKGLIFLNRKMGLALLLAIALLVGVSGLAADSAFAGEKIETEVRFRIEVVKVIGDSNQRGYGKIWFTGIDTDGGTVDGVGKVFFEVHPETEEEFIVNGVFAIEAKVLVNTGKRVTAYQAVGMMSKTVYRLEYPDCELEGCSYVYELIGTGLLNVEGSVR